MQIIEREFGVTDFSLLSSNNELKFVIPIFDFAICYNEKDEEKKMAVWLYCCMAVLLYGCIVIWLFRYTCRRGRL